MADGIQITTSLINQLVVDELKPKKITKKSKPRIPRETHQSQKKVQPKEVHNAPEVQNTNPAAGPVWTPFFQPTPKLQPSLSPELDAIRSVLNESEIVMEKLQTLEENMSKEVTQRAKELHEKEFKLPQQKTIVCEPEMKSCLECYKENVKEPLKCSVLVSGFQECVRRARKQAKLT